MADSWRLERRVKWKKKRLPFNIHIFKDSYANPYQKYFIKKEEYYESRNTTRTLAYIPTGNKFNKMLRDFYTLISNFSLFFCVSRYPHLCYICYPIFFFTSLYPYHTNNWRLRLYSHLRFFKSERNCWLAVFWLVKRRKCKHKCNLQPLVWYGHYVCSSLITFRYLLYICKCIFV